MDPVRWKKVEDLFSEALNLAPGERNAFLLQDCGEDREIIQEVLSLLQFQSKPGVLDETAALTPPPMAPNFGSRFRILRCLGMGGMGSVYEAEDLELGGRVALKTIRPEIAANPQIVERFKREIALGKRITHPTVCRIHDLGVAMGPDGGETLFLTMEFLDGETLASRIGRGAIPVGEASPLLQDMSEALTAAHHAGIIHRDFKSANVMLVPRDGRTCAVVTDFGLAVAIHSSGATPITAPGALAGTVDYMAPEQLRGEEVTPATDVYALGVVMYEMVTGRRPFAGGTNLSIALQHLNAQPTPPRSLVPELDPSWNRAILACLEKSPQARLPSAAAVLDSLAGGGGSNRRASGMRRWRKAVAPALLAGLALAMVPWVYRARVARAIPAQKRVAVLQFENAGHDPSNQAFSEGLMESLTSKLTNLESPHGTLSVVPASDVRREHVTSAREARRSFNANLVITGMLQRSAQGVRLIVNVIDAKEVRQLRSHEIFIPQSDPIAMQQGVIKEITGLLDIYLRPEAEHQIARGSTMVPGAYEFYLQASGYLLAGLGGTDQAIAEFQHALTLDPKYALAYAGLGEAYWRKYLLTKDPDWVRKAWDECNRAVKLDPGLAAAHVTLAILHNGTGQYQAAIDEARQATLNDPANFQAHSELARALDAQGHTKEAEATLQRAIQLRPEYWNNYARLGNFYLRHNRYSDAETPYRQVMQLVPDNPLGYTNLGVVLHLEGRETEAEEFLKKSIQVRPTPSAYSNLATVYFFEGRYADAVPVLEKVVAEGTKDYLIWGNLGDAYRWTPGQSERAIDAYRKALGFAKQALQVNPRNAQALSSVALYQAKSGQLQEALKAARLAVAAGPEDKGTLFNVAIVYELAQQRDKAMEYLSKAIRDGYSQSEAATEPELRNLRKDVRYTALVSEKKAIQ